MGGCLDFGLKLKLELSLLDCDARNSVKLGLDLARKSRMGEDGMRV